VLEGRIELVDGVGTKRVADLGTVQRDAYRALVASPMVGDVGEVEAGHLERYPQGLNSADVRKLLGDIE
jgi:hypothetical protein